MAVEVELDSGVANYRMATWDKVEAVAYLLVINRVSNSWSC